MASGAGVARGVRPQQNGHTKMMMAQLVDYLNTPILIDYGIFALIFFVGLAVGVIVSESRRK